MKTEIAALDFKRMEQPEFSHAEAVEILGVTGNTLLTWNKRGFTLRVVLFGTEPVSPKSKPGRGNHRRYSVSDLIYLHLFRKMTVYLGQVEAARMALSCVPLVLAQFQMTFATETANELDETDCGAYLVFEQGDGHAMQFIAPNSEKGRMADPNLLSKWFRESGDDSVAVISIYWVALNLFSRMADVRAARQAK